jgi:hypothetical protein
MSELTELSKEDFIALLKGTKKGESIVFARACRGDQFRLLTDNNLFIQKSNIHEWARDVNYVVTSAWEDLNDDSKTTLVLNVGEYEKKYHRDSDEICLMRKGGGSAKVAIDLSADNSVTATIEEFGSLAELAEVTDWGLIHRISMSEQISKLADKVDLILTHLMYMPGGEGAAETKAHFDSLAG